MHKNHPNLVNKRLAPILFTSSLQPSDRVKVKRIDIPHQVPRRIPLVAPGTGVVLRQPS